MAPIALLKKLHRFAITLGHLRISQLFVYFIRRKLPVSRASDTTPPIQIRSLKLEQPIRTKALRATDGTFRFLNTTKAFSQEKSWNPEDVSRLWRYNLHYFDYLRQLDIPAGESKKLINSWVEQNPQGTEPGWEPFTASLRIVNWIIARRLDPQLLNQAAIKSLYVQARWLYRNDERHILANHYFENLKALTFAGAFFQGAEAGKWLRRGTKGIRAQLEEQQLADGGHFERSPQYHALMLENYLDLYNLTSCNPDLFDPELVSELKTAGVAALDWLNDVLLPDGAIPLFNDSAFGIAPTAADLNAYAHRLFEYEPGQTASSVHIVNKDVSGLYGMRADQDMILMDCGDIGPAYQPGHTHCDFLSYELMLDGNRIVVDTGVYEYEPGEMRQYVRSTRAHNTVAIDDDEQSEIWGEFRVGRRARKLWGKVEDAGRSVKISGRYRGFFGETWGFKPKFTIERRMEVTHANRRIVSVDVADLIEGKGSHQLENFVHFHPACAFEENGQRTIVIGGNRGKTRIILTLGEDCDYEIRDTWYCPQFGVQQANKCIVMKKHGPLPTKMSYRIQRVSEDAG